MEIINNTSAQRISWVKSNKKALESNLAAISNLYYPESVDELVGLISRLAAEGATYELIGHSSNTLFLPSYHVDHLICTRKMSSWYETDTEIVCEGGVNVATLSETMIKAGYMGFEGLTDLPGTIAGAVYGNSGCRHCSVNALVNDVELFTNDGIMHLSHDDLKLSYRSSVFKRKEIEGTILRVRLRKCKGDSEELQKIANKNHEHRKKYQPSGANNLGTTFNCGQYPTLKCRLLRLLEKCIQVITCKKDSRFSYPLMLRCIGKGTFSPYVYRWNRYMFLDTRAHELFPQYIKFVRTLYKDARLEIEIRK